MSRPALTIAVVVAAALLSLTACSDPKDDDQTPAGECRGSYSGALAGTFTCEATASADGGTVTVDISSWSVTGSAQDLVPATITWTGALAVGEYSEASSGVGSYSAVFGTGVVYWATRSAGVPDSGTFSLVLTSVAPAVVETEYEVHGSFTATLERFPVDETAADIALEVTF